MADEPKRPKSSRPVADPHSPQARAMRSQSKQDFVSALLSQGMAMVRIDARRPNVRVPARFAADPSLALNLSWRFPDARMVLNDRGIAATLTFGGQVFRCALPWSSIWGARLVKESTLKLWEADLPVEMGGPPQPASVDELQVELRPTLVKLDDLPPLDPSEEVARTESASPALKAVPDQPDAAPARPKLRLVK